MCTQQLLDEIVERFEIISENDPDALMKILQVIHRITHTVVVEKHLD